MKSTPEVLGLPGLASPVEVEALLGLGGLSAEGEFHDPRSDDSLSGRAFRVVAGDDDVHGLETLLARISMAAGFPRENLGPLRIVACSSTLGRCNRGCGQRVGLLCLCEEDKVFFPHLGLLCIVRAGDFLVWPNAIRSIAGDTDGYGNKNSEKLDAKPVKQRVLEDLRTSRIHVGNHGSFAVEVSFHDVPVRERREEVKEDATDKIIN